MEAAFFDLDKTIVARSSSLALGRSFFKEGLITRSLLLKSLYAQLMFQLMGADEDKMERMRREAARLTEGWEAVKVREVVEEVLDEVITPLIYSEALELLHDHREAGRLVCLVSSSPEESSRRSPRGSTSIAGSPRSPPSSTASTRASCPSTPTARTRRAPWRSWLRPRGST